MTWLWNSAPGLLVVTGICLGLSLPLGKIATDAGVPAVLWALLLSLGGGSVLLLSLMMRGKRVGFGLRKLRYFLIVASVTYAIPNLLLFSALPHLGAGYTGIMYTLSPVVTLVLAMLFRARQPNLLGIVGIAVGFAGALLVASTRGEAGAPADLFWVVMGLMIPVSLAVGNIYRTLDLPPDADPIELAVGSNLAAAVLLFGYFLLVPQTGSIGLLANVPLAALAQVASASAMFAVFFRLQAVGGPVYLSQIGYVGAAVGLFSGTVFLDEHYRALTWAGAAVIVAGVLLTTKAQRQQG